MSQFFPSVLDNNKFGKENSNIRLFEVMVGLGPVHHLISLLTWFFAPVFIFVRVLTWQSEVDAILPKYLCNSVEIMNFELPNITLKTIIPRNAGLPPFNYNYNNLEEIDSVGHGTFGVVLKEKRCSTVNDYQKAWRLR